jgi:hypothetical protein
MAQKFRDLKINDYFVDCRERKEYPIVYKKKSLSRAHPLINGKKGKLIRDVESVPPEVFSAGAYVIKITV